jgi:fructose-specific phosphotransferase system IIC component
VHEDLRSRLTKLVESDGSSNDAFTALLGDYTRYHVALAVVGGTFLLVLLALCYFFWRRFRRAPRPAEARRWTFERTTYFAFGVVTALVALFLVAIVAANVSTSLNPRQGFAGSLSMLDTMGGDSATQGRYDAFDAWIASSSPAVPSQVHALVEQRLAWQQPKAAITAVLLVIVALACAGIWRSLIRRSRRGVGQWTRGAGSRLLTGIAAAATCLVLMLMVMGNTQASVVSHLDDDVLRLRLSLLHTSISEDARRRTRAGRPSGSTPSPSR